MDLKGSDTSQLSTETTYELGYSNTIGDKFSYSVDVYNIQKQHSWYETSYSSCCN